ncbi:MAG: hypothetical protein A2545_00290 [Planctomycetes bacterium RIFOXYD2_FULL_41_16]|nr:MAG: hypothetical protein A2545_00290 [Planctomycetes bacterium RIFOXYD2_FULL_41_16]
MKPIRLSGHAREQLYFRGTTEEEILESITTVSWQDAELGRLECKKNFVFEKEWNKKYYKTGKTNFCGRRQRDCCNNSIYLFFLGDV